MRYRRALVLAEAVEDVRAVVREVRRALPYLERACLVVAAPPSVTPSPRAVEELRAAGAGLGVPVDVCLASLEVPALAELALTENVDLLVAGTRSRRVAAQLLGVRSQLAVGLLWPRPDDAREGPLARMVCVALGRAGHAGIATFLRDHADAGTRVTVLSTDVLDEDELATRLAVAGIHATVETLVPGPFSLRRWLDPPTDDVPVDLFALTRIPATLLAALPWSASVIVAAPTSALSLVTRRVLDVADVVDDGGPLRARVEEVSPVGSLTPVPDRAIAIVSDGRTVATAISSGAGELEIAAGLAASSLGLLRLDEEPPTDPVPEVEAWISVLRPGARALVVFDAELSDEGLAHLSAAAASLDHDALAVRMRPTRRASLLRDRLRAAGLPSSVIDARAVLDEGEALDVAPENDRVRLARVAARLRRAGFLVVGCFAREPFGDEAPGLEPIADDDEVFIGGNRLVIELDNARARRSLLEGIAEARASVCFQVYMAADDDIGRALEHALATAAARGVVVRVLVDSLHGLHGSFGTENALLSRVAARPGIAVRLGRPVRELSIADLKLRDHRKVVVLDGARALVGGRNLAHEYYTGFAEAALSAATPWREVPWLDAGAELEGPAVREVARAFREAWREAGGEDFALEAPPPSGETSVQVVVHRGLRDARALEAYLAAIDGARSHVFAVNGFPFLLELQHALVRAVRRGVRVRVLTGHLAPTHDGTPFDGPWSAVRATATALVHSRLDPIVEAGGEVSLFAKQGVAGWAEDLGRVHPHVHAKLLTVDGRRAIVGSANLDVTSAYWESELSLVVDEPALVGALEAEIEALFLGSVPVDRADPVWREAARRRAWMRRWPGLLAL